MIESSIFYYRSTSLDGKAQEVLNSMYLLIGNYIYQIDIKIIFNM